MSVEVVEASAYDKFGVAIAGPLGKDGQGTEMTIKAPAGWKGWINVFSTLTIGKLEGPNGEIRTFENNMPSINMPLDQIGGLVLSAELHNFQRYVAGPGQ